jgi:hypothetical protein
MSEARRLTTVGLLCLLMPSVSPAVTVTADFTAGATSVPESGALALVGGAMVHDP